MTRPLWTAQELIEATGGTQTKQFDADGVSIDTRTLEPADLFIALVGEGRDGHSFVPDAIARGAAGAMAHTTTGQTGMVQTGMVQTGMVQTGMVQTGMVRAATGFPQGAALLQVDDTLAGLTRLGGYARMRFGAADPENRLVAITGSVGKTTTKEMLRAALDRFGPTHAAVASYNNHWGVPLTLARLPLEARYCVAEIGMNHAGEIAPLARLAQPHVAVITTIAAAHIGYLGSIEAIADEKASLMQGLEPHGVAVLPLDSPQFPRLHAAAGDAAMLTFGAGNGADVRLLAIEPDADGSHIRLAVFGHELALRLNAPGRHMAMNALAALAAVVGLGLDPAQAIPALEAFRPVAGRGVRRSLMVRGAPVLLLDESYNGNGASMRAALEVLRLQPAGRRVAVLGDMLELGDEGPAEHASLADAVAASADMLFTCGPLMHHLSRAVPSRLRGAHAADAAALAPLVAGAVAGGDAVLVKGSLGSRMKTVVAAIAGASDYDERVA